MSGRIENTIINQLIFNEEFTRKVIPFIKTDYFIEPSEKIITEEIIRFFDTYNALPNREVLAIAASKRKDLTESENKEIQQYISTLKKTELNSEWLETSTEKFCQERAVHNAIFESIRIIDGKNKELDANAIPLILQQALSISFDSSIGHDYFDNAEDRWEYYHAKDENRIPFDLSIFNKITRGGLKNKTLNCVMAPTGLGKSIFMCHVAKSTLEQGKNVLYITMEMSEEDISERIDSNILNVSMDNVQGLDKKTFLGKINKIKEKTQGKLIVKEFASGSHSGHFRALIEDLKRKQDFRPDLIIIDYLGICGSQKLRQNANVNTNTYMKQVSEELRNLGKEYNVPVFTGMQVNRGGMENSDIDITNTADSIGTTNTFDLLFVMMGPEELVKQNQYLVKQLKNRYADVNIFNKFIIGIDKSFMRFYDVNNDTHEKISDRGDIPPRSSESSFDSFNYD